MGFIPSTNANDALIAKSLDDASVNVLPGLSAADSPFAVGAALDSVMPGMNAFEQLGSVLQRRQALNQSARGMRTAIARDTMDKEDSDSFTAFNDSLKGVDNPQEVASMVADKLRSEPENQYFQKMASAMGTGDQLRLAAKTQPLLRKKVDSEARMFAQNVDEEEKTAHLKATTALEAAKLETQKVPMLLSQTKNDIITGIGSAPISQKARDAVVSIASVMADEGPERLKDLTELTGIAHNLGALSQLAYSYQASLGPHKPVLGMLARAGLDPLSDDLNVQKGIADFLTKHNLVPQWNAAQPVLLDYKESSKADRELRSMFEGVDGQPGQVEQLLAAMKEGKTSGNMDRYKELFGKIQMRGGQLAKVVETNLKHRDDMLKVRKADLEEKSTLSKIADMIHDNKHSDAVLLMQQAKAKGIPKSKAYDLVIPGAIKGKKVGTPEYEKAIKDAMGTIDKLWPSDLMTSATGDLDPATSGASIPD